MLFEANPLNKKTMTLGHGAPVCWGQNVVLCQVGRVGITPTSNEVADLTMEPREGLPEVRLVIDIQTEYCIAEPLRPMGGGDENVSNAV